MGETICECAWELKEKDTERVWVLLCVIEREEKKKKRENGCVCVFNKPFK